MYLCVSHFNHIYVQSEDQLNSNVMESRKWKKIHGSWEDVSEHFSSLLWKGGGIDGRVSLFDWSVCLLTLKHLVSLQSRVRSSVQTELDLHTEDLVGSIIPYWCYKEVSICDQRQITTHSQVQLDRRRPSAKLPERNEKRPGGLWVPRRLGD